jgi:hypothetical protein
MQQQEYRETIIETLNKLEVAQTRLFTAMVNVGMKGTHIDIDTVFDLGEVYDFEIEMFEDSGDANLDIIVKLLKQMEAAKQSLMNLNAIDEDDIDEVPLED